MKKRFLIIFLVLLFLSTSALYIHNSCELNDRGIVVLLYHKIKEKGDSNKYVLEITEFEKQLKYLKDNGYNTILPTDTITAIPIDSFNKTVILTFDDGTKDHYKNVYPLLRKYDYEGLFFVVTKYINSPGCLSTDEIREMSLGGMGIGSHSYSHPLLDAIEKDKMYSQLQLSKEYLDNLSINPILDLAPPGGWFDDNVVKAAVDIGYERVFSCNIGPTDISQDPVVFNRIEVLGDMSIDDFVQLLNPEELFLYKLEQSLKFIIHDIVGSKNYQNWF